MLSFFKKKAPKASYRDLIWISYKEKQLGLLPQIKKEMEKRPVFIVSSFNDSLSKIEEQLSALNMTYKRLSHLTEWTIVHRISTLHSSLLDIPRPLVNESEKLTVFLEHYPTLTQDTQNIELASKNLSNNNIHFYLSLEDPIFRDFPSERITNTLRKLGAEENEHFEHKMISKSIKNLQKKIEEKVQGSPSCSSEKEWYQLNVRD